jgi:4'-phosphopantetheinyl transferase
VTDSRHPVVPAPGEVHVWWIDLDTARDEAETTLSPNERARAARFRHHRDRVRWTRARVAVRQILAGYLGQPPHAVEFTPAAIQVSPLRPPFPIAMGRVPSGRRLRARASGAKPALANDPRLRFNLAHAGGRAVLAVAWEREVGIDLEPIDDGLDLLPLLAVACAPAEIARIEALPSDQRIGAFLALWTVKEAYLKAIGVGMFREPRTLEVEFLADGRASVHDAHEKDDPPRWDVRLLDAGCGWVAALAAAGAGQAVRTFPWRTVPEASS